MLIITTIRNRFFKAGLGIEAKGLLKNKFFYRIAGIGGVRKTNSFYNPQTFISDSLGNGAFLFAD